MSWNSIIVKLIGPYFIFVGFFVFSKHQVGGYLCGDCFANSFEKIVVDIIAAIFLIGSIIISYKLKNEKKEWKISYTFLIMILFLITFYAVMAIGDYFYVGTGGRTF